MEIGKVMTNWLKIAVVSAAAWTCLSATALAANDELENLPGMPSAENNVWRYYAQGEEGNPTNAACIVNGDWIIGAKYESAYDELWLYDYYAGEGVLNMLKTILETKDGTKASPSKIIWQNGWSKAPVTELWMTDLATTIRWNSDKTYNSFGGLPRFGSRGAKAGNPNIRRIYVKSDVLEFTGSENLINCYYLTNIVLRCPNLVRWNGNSEGIMSGTSLTNEITEVVSPNLQEMSGGALGGCITGSFVATNQLGHIISFGQCTNVYLRGDNYEGNNGGATGELLRGNKVVKSMTLIWPKIERFGSSEWTQSSVLEDFTVYMPNLTNVYSGTMSQATQRKKTTILGPALSTNVVKQLVAGMSPWVDSATSQRERGVLYCSKNWGWKKLATKLEAGTYEAENAPEGCFGVFVGYTRVYMVHLPQDGEPVLGMIMVVR